MKQIKVVIGAWACYC